MTWSFDESLPSAKDRVRDLINDVDPNNPILSDESIAVYLSGGSQEQTSELLAAACCLEKIATRFAQRATSISEGGGSVNWGDRSKRYSELAAQLRATAANQESAGGLFAIAEFAIPPFGDREVLRNDLLRSGL